MFINFVLQLLETYLPAREKVEVPTGEHVEEVNLHDYDPRTDRGGSRGGEAYHEDSDSEEAGGPRVQCAHQ